VPWFCRFYLHRDSRIVETRIWGKYSFVLFTFRWPWVEVGWGYVMCRCPIWRHKRDMRLKDMWRAGVQFGGTSVTCAWRNFSTTMKNLSRGYEEFELTAFRMQEQSYNSAQTLFYLHEDWPNVGSSNTDLCLSTLLRLHRLTVWKHGVTTYQRFHLLWRQKKKLHFAHTVYLRFVRLRVNSNNFST
jgi:hypothetical protein